MKDLTPDSSAEIQVFALAWLATLGSTKSQRQLVKGLLIAGALFLVFGDSNSGKTFWVLDLALAIAAGLHWRGRRVQRGLVVYIAGEGAWSVRLRLAAYLKAHPEISAGIPFAIISQPVDFLSDDSINALIATIRAAESECGEQAVLVIADTFARALGVSGADESSAQDVGRAICGIDRVRVETGVAFGLVHHAGKDPAKGARGSSALRAATDTEILIEGQEGTRTASVTKQRDLEPIPSVLFDLVTVELGRDDDGEPLTSCVVKHSDAPAAASGPNRAQLRGKAQRQLLAAIRAQTAEHGGTPWTLPQLREVGRKAGMSKSTARYAVDALVATPYMLSSVGGYLFTDGAQL